MSDTQRDLEAFKVLIRDRARRVVQGCARALYDEMSSGGTYSPGTPIKTGFHRSHWDAAVGGLPQSTSAADPAAAEARVAATIEEFAPGSVLFVTNNGPAIRRLEFDGWSTQAPDGFVRPAVEAWQQIVNSVAEGLTP